MKKSVYPIKKLYICLKINSFCWHILYWSWRRLFDLITFFWKWQCNSFDQFWYLYRIFASILEIKKNMIFDFSSISQVVSKDIAGIQKEQFWTIQKEHINWTGLLIHISRLTLVFLSTDQSEGSISQEASKWSRAMTSLDEWPMFTNFVLPICLISFFSLLQCLVNIFLLNKKYR